jgi:hypothetical protein
MPVIRRIAVCAGLAALVISLGCKQGLGDRCHLDSDCVNGLVCVIPMGGNRIIGGTCQVAAPDMGVDMSGPVDGADH